MLILLVEDNPCISEFIVQGLKESNHSVVLVEDGASARNLITERSWDIILLDIMLPEVDGMELIQYSRHKNVDVPILVITALNDAEDKIKALNYGADDYLQKPFLFRELMTHINALKKEPI